VIPLLSSSNSPKLSAGSLTLVMFLAGRFIGYMLVGILVGIIGTNIQHYAGGSLFGMISVALGVTLLYFGIQKNFPELKVCRLIKNSSSRKTFLILLGFFTGVNLCPPFLAAIVGATGTGTVAGSMIYFSVFFIGTVVFFPITIFFGFLSKISSVRQIANICMMISGVWFTFKGVFSLF
jgi:sulfite exporter TauE/SafE